jgi:hypothetical protein
MKERGKELAGQPAFLTNARHSGRGNGRARLQPRRYGGQLERDLGRGGTPIPPRTKEIDLKARGAA